jgi:dolichol-phosphate mannosyltransferase
MRAGKIIVLLPAYNEAAVLERLLDRTIHVLEAEGLTFQIVVCDDGSKDATGAILARRRAADPRIVPMLHKLNRGLAETVRDLFEYAAEVAGDDDVVIRFDCDDTHDPKYIPTMLRKLDEGFDVVIASRFQPGGRTHGLEGSRLFVSRAANLMMRVLFAVPGVREYSCGFRAYRGVLVRRAIAFYGNDFVQLKGFGFVCTLEKLVKLHLLRARFGEIGFELHYDRKEGVSKMVASVTTLGYLVMVVMYYWPWGGWRRYYRAQLAGERAR